VLGLRVLVVGFVLFGVPCVVAIPSVLGILLIFCCFPSPVC
jgi:hypothetical protein